MNEVEGGPRAGAHLLEFDSVHGRWAAGHHERRPGADRRRSHARLVGCLRAGGCRLGADSASTSSSSARGGSARGERSTPYFWSAALASVVVAAPVKDGSALNVVVGVNDDRYDPAVALDRDRGVVHDELSRAGGQGAARGDRDQPRLDHDAPQPHQHPDDRRRAPQGPPAGACGGHVADPDDDRIGDGDRPDLPRARGPARRARGAGAAAQRIAHRLRVRARARDRRGGGQRPPPRRGRPARSRASSASRSGRS